jgi:uncharacterized protein YodC (DUF2158 family)
MDLERKIDVGDVVQHRAGGPWMTVDRLAGEYVVCLWHDGDGLRREAFRLADLIFPELGTDDDPI